MSQPPQGGPGPQGGQPPEGPRPPQGQGGGAQGPAQGPGPQGPRPQGPNPGQGPQGYPQGGQQGYPQQGYPPGQGGPGQQGYPGGQQGYPGPGFPQQGQPPRPAGPGQPYAAGPGQPYAGGPGQPYGGGPGPQGGGYGYGPGPGPQGLPPNAGQPPAQPAAKKRTGLLVLVGVGALALILAVVAIAVNVGGSSEGADAGGATSSSGTGGSTPTAGAPAATASDAVSGFLGALVQQDPQKALSYAADPNLDTRLMTPKVLATSAKLAPIANVQVPPVADKDATTVQATYTLGSTPVSTTFEVVKVGDEWKLSKVAAPVDVTVAQAGSMPMLVNGVRVKSGSLTLLPGAYRFTTGQRNFDYGRHPDVLVQSPTEEPDATRLAPGVSSKGKASALKAVRKSWSSCLKSKNPEPKGCPNRWTGKYNFKKGSVKWTRKGSDPTRKPKAYPTSSSITYQVKLNLSLKGPCTYKGQSGTCTGTLTGYANANVAVKASKVKVRWQT